MAEILPYQHLAPASRRRTALWFAWGALWVAMTGVMIDCLIAATTLWPVPAGSFIRPMGLTALMALVAMGTFGATLVLVHCTRPWQRRHWRASIVVTDAIALAVAVAALPCSWAALNWVISRHALVLEP